MIAWQEISGRGPAGLPGGMMTVVVAAIAVPSVLFER